MTPSTKVKLMSRVLLPLSVHVILGILACAAGFAGVHALL